MKIWVVFKRELGAYFNSAIAYIFLVFFLALTGYYFAEQLFTYREAEMRPLFQLFPYTFLFIVPAVSMRIWAEEKKSGTFEMILTLPMRDGEVVWGKFLAAWAFLGVGIVLTFPWTFMVGLLAAPSTEVLASGSGGLASLDWMPILMGYMASILLAGAYLAIGSYISSLTKNQIVAFILTTSILAVFLFISQEMFMNFLEKTSQPLSDLLYYLSFAPHFDSISRGILDIKDVVYFSTVIIFFLELNRLSVSHRD